MLRREDWCGVLCERVHSHPPPTWVLSECYSSAVMFVRLMTQHTSRLVKYQNVEEINFLINFWHFQSWFLTSKLEDLLFCKNHISAIRLSLGQLRVSNCFFVVLTPNKIVPLTFDTGKFVEKKKIHFSHAMTTHPTPQSTLTANKNVKYQE